MKGIDISHHNGVVDFEKVRSAGYEFVFAKCSQYVKDVKYEANKAGARKAGLLFGAYHFANATDPVKEADLFLSLIGELKTGEIVVLDYETNALADPASWCLRWSKRVEEKLGFKPLLYTYHALLKKYDWKKLSDNGNGLWAARYGMQTQEPVNLFKPATGSWPFYAIWQYCSKGKVPGTVGNVDLNTTEMDTATLKKYGKPGQVEECKKCLIHCPK